MQSISAVELRSEFEKMTDKDVSRYHYCYEIGSTFVALSLMEDTIIGQMLMCSKVNLLNKLGDDTKSWQNLTQKQEQLQDSTLGSLISILAKHNLLNADLEYLKWVKKKRDFFIHRFFHIGCWPGEMSETQIASLVRTLRYLELTYIRASRKIGDIFVRAGLLQVTDLGGAGKIYMNEISFD